MTNELKAFIEQETKHSNYSYKTFDRIPVLHSTSLLVDGSLPAGNKTEVVLRPSMAIKAIFIVFLLMALLMGAFIINIARSFNMVPVAVVFLLLFVTIFAIGFYKVFRRKNQITLRINVAGIAVNEEMFPWRSISETHIMKREITEDTHERSLVLELKTGKIKKIPLVQIALSDRKLAAIIESYKS